MIFEPVDWKILKLTIKGAILVINDEITFLFSGVPSSFASKAFNDMKTSVGMQRSLT